MAVIDLVDSIKKGSVNYANVKTGFTHQVGTLTGSRFTHLVGGTLTHSVLR